MNDLGKLKNVLKEKCPDCGHNLEVRTRGTVSLGTRYFSKDEIICLSCGYSITLQPEKRRMKRNADTEYED